MNRVLGKKSLGIKFSHQEHRDLAAFEKLCK